MRASYREKKLRLRLYTAASALSWAVIGAVVVLAPLVMWMEHGASDAFGALLVAALGCLLPGALGTWLTDQALTLYGQVSEMEEQRAKDAQREADRILREYGRQRAGKWIHATYRRDTP